MDIILDTEYIDTVGENIDPRKIMCLENQEKQVLTKQKLNENKIEDPRTKKPTESKDEEIFEQRCVIPDLHPMKKLPALACEENEI